MLRLCASHKWIKNLLGDLCVSINNTRKRSLLNQRHVLCLLAYCSDQHGMLQGISCNVGVPVLQPQGAYVSPL